MIKQLAFAATAIAFLCAEQPRCWAEDYAVLARELRAADPGGDAKRKAEAGDFRLIQITDAWGGPWLPGVVCLLPASASSLHGDLFFSDAIYGEGDSAYRNAQTAYASTFNREIVSHRSYPFADVCRTRFPNEPSLRDPRYLSLSEWRLATRENRHDGTLASATRLGDRQAVRELLNADANPNQRDLWAVTPLEWAALRGDAEVARALLAHGADPNVSCERCATPLNLAVIGGSQDVIALLIDAGAALDADSEALQPHSEDLPSGSALWAATALGRDAILRQLIGAGANPNTINGTTATLRAVLRRDIVSLRMLLAAGADPNAHNNDVAPIQAAAEHDFAEGVRALLYAGAAAEARSDFEERMWRLAAERAQDAILFQLIASGAHLHVLAEDQRNAVAAAIEGRNETAVAGLLSDADRRWEQMREAISAGDVAETRRLLAQGAGIMRGHGESELIVAIERGQARIAEILLAIGADPTATAHPDSAKWLGAGSFGTVDWDVTDQRSVFGRTPYQYNAEVSPAMLAFNTGPLEIVDLVVEGVGTNDRNVTNPENSYIDQAFRGYERHRDRRILERARMLGGPPAFTGAQADQFLRDICFWTREDAPTVMQAYLEMGYRPRTAQDPERQAGWPGDDPALSSCINASDRAAIMLLAYGADPDQPNSIGEPALWEAVEALNSADGSIELVEQLLAAGANPNAPGPYNPLRYAIARSRAAPPAQAARFEEAARLLRRHGAQSSQETDAADEPPLLPVR